MIENPLNTLQPHPWNPLITRTDILLYWHWNVC